MPTNRSRNKKKKYNQIEGDDDLMANSEAHIVLHCLVFSPLEVGGEKAGGQGEDGDEVMISCSMN